MYRIIILCFSYLANWLPFFNKPIDWIDWLTATKFWTFVKTVMSSCRSPSSSPTRHLPGPHQPSVNYEFTTLR